MLAPSAVSIGLSFFHKVHNRHALDPSAVVPFSSCQSDTLKEKHFSSTPANLVPFSVNFLSDNFEVEMEADAVYANHTCAFSRQTPALIAVLPRTLRGQAGNQGFALVYVMDAIGCNAAAASN